MFVLFVLVMFVLGLIVGSFLNVVIYRVPAKRSIVTPRSACPGCGTELANRDNVPVLSWLVLRGKCRTCSTAISARYPLVELGTGIAFALLAVRFGVDAALPAFLFLTAGLIALSAIDLDTYLLPKAVVWPTLILTSLSLLVAAAVTPDWRGAAEAVAGGLIAFAVLFVIHFISPRGMGFGDVRLAGLLGVALGWIELPVVAVGLFLAFLLASVLGVALIALGVRGRKDKVPFGPFLALGAYFAFFVGTPIIDLYLGR